MDIRQPKSIQAKARAMLGKAAQYKKILLYYCGISAGISLVVTLLGAVVDSRMAGAGGLGNLGLRSILSTIQSILPMFNTLSLLVLDMGLVAAMLRIARGQYSSPQTLRLGIARFFPLLRTTLLESLFYLGAGVASLYVGMAIFFLTPLSRGAMEVIAPMVTAQTDLQVLLDSILLDDALLEAFFRSIIPMYVIMLLVFLSLIVPLHYRLRLTRYILIDDPQAGAFRAVGTSYRLTRRKCMNLFRLDLHYWWYYVLQFLSVAVSYSPLILSLLGVEGFLTGTVADYLFYGISLAASCGLVYFFGAQVQVSRALICDALLPKEEPKDGVILGSIFQM